MKTYYWNNGWIIKLPTQITSIEDAILKTPEKENEAERKALSAAIIQRSEAKPSKAEVSKLEGLILEKLEVAALNSIEIESSIIHLDLESNQILGHIRYKQNGKVLFKHITE